ncbi:amino acid adenylation domain-containing protein (plasmid) [Massilia forsythiae]|uniref:Amino acid adenylation domain-containing protein n=1 Tax=Massilia forsythiae TaxID=2728020 RepID=A0A7Z2W1X8_9BURK|nr:non-ribosomal peptide synthetase [Massilia forsythiae]QJE03668.1 amino acid adenylation domain-containing protein [Massilia forsythiae]
MTEIVALFDELTADGVSFWLENGELRFRAPTSVMSKERIELIRRHKAEAIAHLMAQVGDGALATAALGTPLSLAQERLWLVEQTVDLGAAYNMAGSVYLNGCLDVDALERSFQAIAQRHDVLRTRFVLQGGEMRQVVDATASVALERVDLSHIAPGERAAHARRLAAAKAGEPFRIDGGALLRLWLFALHENQHILLISMHHAISDGWSIAVLVRELVVLYQAFVAGERSPLAPLPIQYRDYAVWQRKRLSEDFLREHMAYWERQLAGCPEATELPLDHPRPALASHRGDEVGFAVSEQTCRSLRALVQSEGTTLFAGLMAALNVLLHRWSGQTDLVVGSPVAGRTHRQTEDLIGLFVNMLPLRARVSPDQPFRAFLRDVAETALAAYAHQEVPFDRLVEVAKCQRTMARQPLFQVALVLENMPQATLTLHGLTLREQRICTHTSKFGLTFFLREADGGLQAYAEYATDLYDRVTIERLVSNFQELLKSIVAQPDCAVSRLQVMTPDEIALQLERWNDTSTPYPACCIHDLIGAQAARTPDRVALIHAEQELDYAVLEASANRLARHLEGQGVARGSIVGVCIERTPDMLIAMLAIMKAGAAYLPLDPNYPGERLRYMLDDAGAALVVTHTALRDKLPDSLRVLCLDAQAAAIASQPASAPAGGATPEDRAYIIYTSGSTGRPKGIDLTHRGAVAFLSWAIDAFQPDEMACVVAATSMCFDLSVFELFGPLCRGGSVLLANNPIDLPPEAARATMLNTVPSALAELLRSGAIPPSVKVVNVAGEPLSPQLVTDIHTRTAVRKVYNLYGPSEDTTYSTFALVPPYAERALIGRPISNTRVYVLDAHLQPLPVGAIGELYIGGAGLARGYLGKPELTAQRFIPSPFAPGDRLYRTGDLVRYLPDGNLDYIGRIDHQVKLRGFRVELGEVEAVLERHARVQQVCALVREDPRGDKRIVAYVACAGAVTTQELQRHMKQALPDYMVPSALVVLETLPLTPNGKIDRNAMPQPDTWGRSESAYAAPSTSMEHALAEAWRDILQLKQVGIHDNFFELGGHSLLVVKLVNMIAARLGRQVPISSFFGAPTVASLAAALAEDGTGPWPRPGAGGIVRLRAADGGTPLFLIHPIGGHLLGYRDLVQALEHAGPVYGLQRSEIAGADAPRFLSIPDLAELYLEQILRVQTHGDYLLCGWSFGGIVALGIAERLQARGKRVRYVGLVDSVLPLAEIDRLRPMRLEAWAKRGVRESLPELPVDVVALAEKVVIGDVEQIPGRLGDADNDFFRQLYLANFWALCTFMPEVGIPHVHLYYATASTRRPEFDASRSCLSALYGVAAATLLEGDHYSILKAPGVAALATAIDADLAAAGVLQSAKEVRYG